MRSRTLTAAVGMVGLLGASLLAGCISNESTGPQKAGRTAPIINAGECGAALGAGGPIEITPAFAAIVQMRPARMRIETVGTSLLGPSLTALGACATTLSPTTGLPALQFTSGSCNVKINGQSIANGLSPLTGNLEFGLIPATALEPGVVVATDALGNVLEIIWPLLAGTGTGDAIVRIQLASWNSTLFASSATMDISYNFNCSALNAAGQAVNASFFGAVAGVPTDGSVLSFAGAPAACPLALAPASSAIVPVSAGIVQFRTNRVRLEVAGDVALTGGTTLESLGLCATSVPASIVVTSANAKITKAGSSTQVTSTHLPLTWTNVTTPVPAGEAGVILAQDINKNVFEIIWPGLAGLPPGGPIIRVQMATWDRARIISGKKLDLTYDFTARMVDAGGIVTTKKFTGVSKGILIP